MVVDAHTGSYIGILLNKVFPYDSFFMPMFVFISGYFFKPRSFLYNLKHKVQQLLIPYFIWNVFWGYIVSILKYFNIVSWGNPVSFHTLLVEVFISGTGFDVNGACWFVIMLFAVSIIYSFIYNVFHNESFSFHILLFLLLLLGGVVSIYTSMNALHLSSDFLLLRKVGFYLPFYQLGHIFRVYMESGICKIPRSLRVGICILINILLIFYFGDIRFNSTAYMNSFTSPFLPFITSVTGILFWYTLSEFIIEKCNRELKYVEYISKNTFTIMECHLFFANIPNFICYISAKKGLISDFNIEVFSVSPWYRYNSITSILGFFCGIIGSLYVIKIVNYINSKIRRVR